MPTRLLALLARRRTACLPALAAWLPVCLPRSLFSLARGLSGRLASLAAWLITWRPLCSVGNVSRHLQSPDRNLHISRRHVDQEEADMETQTLASICIPCFVGVVMWGAGQCGIYQTWQSMLDIDAFNLCWFERRPQMVAFVCHVGKR